MDDNNDNRREEIYSEKVQAGKRTYFFDVKATRSNDYYLTITESKRRFKDDEFVYEKHKLFLYKEDFHKFVNALKSTVDHIKEELMPEVDFDEIEREDENRQERQ
ncbi:MAG: DNA-binding protein [Flammeovirgaceae bacterium TMED32]|nr:MAG: DNA-binding protein [Flammeovirgaceae bacterium TMED32]